MQKVISVHTGTCDSCGDQFENVGDPPTELTSGMALFGAFRIKFDLCDDCMTVARREFTSMVTNTSMEKNNAEESLQL